MIGMTENQLRLIERFGVSIQNHVVVGDMMVGDRMNILKNGTNKKEFLAEIFIHIITLLIAVGLICLNFWIISLIIQW